MMTYLGIVGYVVLGNSVCANLLDNFSEDDQFINAGRFFYGVTVMLTYPIEAFVAREVIQNVFFNGEELSNIWHYSLTSAICIMVFVVAFLTNALGLVFEINGVINATLLAYVLPGIKFSSNSPYPIVPSISCFLLT
eukprot:m.173657 g.173657  ORF g.173657 m.173657 type:complete len:137 (+) comp15391_c0_seq5:84-494(+)